MADKLLTAIDTLRYENAQYHTANYKVQEEQTRHIEDVSRSIGELLSEFKGSRLDAEEARRDAGKGSKSSPDAKDTKKDDTDDINLKGILQIVAGIGAAVTGFVVGLSEGFLKIFKGISKFIAKTLRLDKLVAPLKNLGKMINTRFVNLGKSIMNTVRAAVLSFSMAFPRITNVLLDFGSRISNIGKGVGTNFGKIVKTFTSSVTNLQNAFLAGTNGVRGVARSANGTFRSLNTIEKFMNTWGKVTGQLGDGIKAIGRIMGDKIVKPFKSFMNGLRGVGQSTSALGKSLRLLFSGFRTIGRFIAFPVTIIMSIIDGFKGMMAGADRQVGTFEKLVGGAIGAITGVLKGLVAMPLDLLKDGISWIAGKLGFENFSKMLDSFSFSELFQMVGDKLADGFVKFFNGIGYIFTNAIQGLMKPFEGGFSLGGLFEFVAKIPLTIGGFLLDMIKNSVSAIASIFGFEDASKAIDSFSFIDLFTGLFDNVFGSIYAFFSDTFGSISSSFMNIFNGDGPLLERIFGFAKNLVTSLFTWPYDLLKNIASGLLGFFGQDDAAQALDSFSFKDTFGKVIDFVVNLPSMLVDQLWSMLEGTAVGDVLSDAMTGAMDIASQFNEWLKGIIREPLSNLATSDNWFDKGLKAIVPSEVFDWAGVDEGTGKITAPRVSAPDTTARTDNGNRVTEMSRQNEQAKSSATNVVVSAPVQTNQNVTNNSTSAIMDNNMPTVDQNDRSWGGNLTWQGGVGLV